MQVKIIALDLIYWNGLLQYDFPYEYFVSYFDSGEVVDPLVNKFQEGRKVLVDLELILDTKSGIG